MPLFYVYMGHIYFHVHTPQPSMFPSSHTRRIYDRYYFILLLLTNKILRGAQYGSNLKFITTMEVALLKHVDKIQFLCFLMN